jgi:hypothetical protein
MGIAVKDASEVTIINNTILNNNTGMALYEKKPIFGGSEAWVYNSIIWDSPTPVDLDEKSAIKIRYSDIEGDYTGKGNINIKPQYNEYYLLSENQKDITEGGNYQYFKDFNLDIDREEENIPMGIIKSVLENDL